MTDPNVPSFFLIILCGFGVVWGYRKSTKSNFKITDFEYLGFSTLWGSTIFIPVFYFLEKNQNLLYSVSIYPFTLTPVLFVLGLISGYFSGYCSVILRNKC